MADRPIIFSGPMVRALLDGRKTQTRRLATSPLRRCVTGDQLYVRESGIYFPGRPGGAGELFRHDVPATAKCGVYWSRNNGGPGAGYNVTGCSRASALSDGRAKVRPSIHMPRWASRLTLIVEEVRFQRLQEISEADAIAEGIETGRHPDTGEVCGWRDYETIHIGRHKGANHPHAIVPYREAWRSYSSLWDELHREPGQRWADNPEIVALTFRVVRENIDRIAA